MNALYPETELLASRERLVLNLYAISALAVFLLLMLFGLTMRAAQGRWINVFARGLLSAHDRARGGNGGRRGAGLFGGHVVLPP